jgi:hypothetical protein
MLHTQDETCPTQPLKKKPRPPAPDPAVDLALDARNGKIPALVRVRDMTAVAAAVDMMIRDLAVARVRAMIANTVARVRDMIRDLALARVRDMIRDLALARAVEVDMIANSAARAVDMMIANAAALVVKIRDRVRVRVRAMTGRLFTSKSFTTFLT